MCVRQHDAGHRLDEADPGRLEAQREEAER